MHPILWQIDPFALFGHNFGPFTIYSYGVIVAFAFAIGAWLSTRMATQDKLEPDVIVDLAFYTLLGGMIGGRVMFSIVQFREYFNACFHPELPNLLNHNMPLPEPMCLNIFYFWEGGMVWYGGMLGAMFATWLYARRKKGLRYAVIADAAFTIVPLGHFIGRLACLCAGCCYGKITDSPLGIMFPSGSLPYTEKIGAATAYTLANVEAPIHPTQLYEALGELTIFLILIVVRYRRRFYGQVALTFLILYPILRTTMEFFRGDIDRGYLIEWTSSGSFGGIPYTMPNGFSTSQVISLLVVIGAIFWTVKLLKRARKDEQTL